MLMDKIENICGIITSYIFRILNPFKKLIITTEAQVHIFNNQQAVKILKKHKHIEAFYLFKQYLNVINEGSVWADQDFKSSSHFYNPKYKKGLFGQPHSLKVTGKYYKKAVHAWKKNDKEEAMFYLGACVHIIQDLTIPHHVNIKLFDCHRKYENFVKTTYDIVREYKTEKEPIIFNDIRSYIEYNAHKAMMIYKKYNRINDKRLKFYKWTRVNLPLSQRTTAGCFLMFLDDVDYFV